MTKILTYKSRTEQVGARKWQLIDNELSELNNGRILLAPRKTITDNITFICSDFADVIAAHKHDIGCAFRKLIYVNLSVEELKRLDLLKLRENRSREEGCEVWACDNIPKNYLSIEPVGFHENNKIFKEILLAAGESPAKANIMYGAVHLNAKWLLSRPKELDIDKIYFEKIHT